MEAEVDQGKEGDFRSGDLDNELLIVTFQDWEDYETALNHGLFQTTI